MAFSSHPDIKAWSDAVSLNPSRVPPDRQGDPELAAVLGRFKAAAVPGMTGLTELAGMSVG
jgi:hypothetical protein